MDRRNFVRLVGGGVVTAATLGAVAACSDVGAYPSEAVEAWNGPTAAFTQGDPRRVALAYAITAPNPHNLQPWLVDLREANVITVYTDKARVLPETDPHGRQILIGHGAFLELLLLSLAEQNWVADVALWPQGELAGALTAWDTRPIARLSLQRPATPLPKEALFAQILRRRTPKSDYDTARPVAANDVQKLIDAVGSTGAMRASVQATVQAGGTVDTARLADLRDVCWQSAQVEMLTPRTFLESMRLTRVGPAEIAQHRDGISLNSPMVRGLTALGLFDRSQPLAPGTQAFKAAMGRFEGHSKTAMGFVWLTSTNRRSDQIAVGRAYVRMQLQATAMGLGLHPMSQALQEFAEMKPHFEKVHQLVLGRSAPIGPQDATVHMLCRLGHPKLAAAASPRRPLPLFVQA